MLVALLATSSPLLSRMSLYTLFIGEGARAASLLLMQTSLSQSWLSSMQGCSMVCISDKQYQSILQVKLIIISHIRVLPDIVKEMLLAKFNSLKQAQQPMKLYAKIIQLSQSVRGLHPIALSFLTFPAVSLCKHIKVDHEDFIFHQQQQRIVRNNMNLAIFLHNQKQYKDSTLPLPLAPLYVLPHQKWYFSAASLTPLRKRRENTSLFKYFEEAQIPSETQEENAVFTFSNRDRQVVCVYEKNNYFDNKVKHIFDVVYSNFSHGISTKERLVCDCNTYIEEQSSKTFITNLEMIGKCLHSSRKNPKTEVLTKEEQKINWYEFTKNILRQQLQIESHSIPQESLYFYKLPENGGKTRPYIFNVLWSDNYVIFNNGNKLEVNQNMKAKAVELCQQVYRKMEEYLWSKVQSFIPKVADEVPDHDKFMHFMRERLRVSTFKLWFYKNAENNQIYILNLSHLTLKGVQCIIYNNFDIKSQPIHPEILKQPFMEEKPRLKDITLLNRSLQNKKKTFSVPSKSHKVLRKLLNPSDTDRMKEIIDVKGFEVALMKPKEILVDEGNQLTEIQCSCCKDLLTATEIVNELTANHIKQIRYLRQLKIGKNEHSPYDFIKVCTLCYNAYLKHHKNQSLEKRSFSQKDKTVKNSESFFEKGTCNFQEYKSRQPSFKSHNNDSKRAFFTKNTKQRAKSELNHSKQAQFSQNQDKIMAKDRSISLRPTIPVPPKQKPKKLHTTKTTNTENTINHREQLQDLNTSKFVIERSQTQQQPIPTNTNCIKFKSQLQNKTHNLINRIISNSFDAKKTTQPQERIRDQAINNFNSKIIMNAIDEYEKIDRVSFKKLVTKNHRMYMLKQPSKQRLEKRENCESDWKKSIKSYFQN